MEEGEDQQEQQEQDQEQEQEESKKRRLLFPQRNHFSHFCRHSLPVEAPAAASPEGLPATAVAPVVQEPAPAPALSVVWPAQLCL